MMEGLNPYQTGIQAPPETIRIALFVVETSHSAVDTVGVVSLFNAKSDGLSDRRGSHFRFACNATAVPSF